MSGLQRRGALLTPALGQLLKSLSWKAFWFSLRQPRLSRDSQIMSSHGAIARKDAKHGLTHLLRHA